MIDSHCHLNFKSLAANIDNVIENSRKNNINSILSINTHPNEFDDHLDLINNFNGVYISYGLHPCEIKSLEDLLLLDFEKSSKNDHVIAFGETGIDLYHSNNYLNEQIAGFEMHIEASLKYNLPLIIHQRNSENEIIDVLNKYLKNDLKIVFHCFTGSEKLLKYCLDNNFYISLSGIITFKNSFNLRNIIKNFPLDFLLIETDSPFLAPEPFRGKTNQPSLILHTAKYLSNFYNINFNEFEKITDNNFFNLFKKTNRYNKL